MKFYLSLHANFRLSTDETFLTSQPVVLNTNAMEVYNSSEIHDTLNSTYGNLVSAVEYFQQRGSGWVLNKLLALDLPLLEFNPLRTTSYIPLPDEVQNRKAVIDIQNKDKKWFLWSVIASLYLKDVQLRNPQRPFHYTQYDKESNLHDISFPMTLNDISKIRKVE